MYESKHGHCFWLLSDGINRCNVESSYQLCGFYFCFYHREQAEQLPYTYWEGLYRKIYPWRFNAE